MEEKELRRVRERNEARAKRKKKRKRIVMIEKIVFSVFCVAVIVVAGVLIYRLLPGVQVARQLKEANAYIETVRRH